MSETTFPRIGESAGDLQDNGHDADQAEREELPEALQRQFDQEQFDDENGIGKYL